MEQAELKNKTDFLDLPDDELPDYPPEVSGDFESEASSDAEEVILTEEDLKNEDSTLDGGLSEQNEEQEDDRDSEENGEQIFEQGSDSSEGSEVAEENPNQSLGEEAQEIVLEASQEAPKQLKPKSKGKGKGTKQEVTETEVQQVTAEAQLQQLFAPFKANGHAMQVGSVNDALTLMKMGANYNKKMQGLKPNLRLMKMLDNNKLLDEEKLSYLIDLQNKNPAAIAKLLKDSGVDPDDIMEDNTDYTPSTYTVNEKEVDLDMVLDEIKDTPSFQKTIDTISTKWDAASRTIVQEDPSIIRVINEHVGNGLYEQIMDVVQNEKALGRLTELSDLQAYKHVGDTLQAQGAFNQASPQANVQQPTQFKAQQDPKLKNRKKAAANTRSAPAKPKVQFDPLSLSDDDFEKVSATLNI